MAVADYHINLENSNGNSIEVQGARYGYNTRVQMAIEFERLDNGLVDAVDHGSEYDVRTCNIELELDETDQGLLTDFFGVSGTTKGRGQSVIFTGPTGSDFRPFGPDKSAVGPYTVAFDLKTQSPALRAPWQYHSNNVRMVNTGTFPAYVVPAGTSYGEISLGTVDGLRFPDEFIKGNVELKDYKTITLGSDSYYTDHGVGGDSSFCEIRFIGDSGKIGSLVAYIAGTMRGNTSTLSVPDGAYPFGRQYGDGGDYTVQLASPVIDIEHLEYREFIVSVKFFYVSGPA